MTPEKTLKRKLLWSCRYVMDELAEFQLNLKIHMFAENDFKMELHTAGGGYSVVCKVSLGEMGTAALKKMNATICKDTAREFMNELLICSTCALENPEHVVAFYGSVIMRSRELGLLFELCGGTLAHFITDQEEKKVSTDKRYSEGRRMMCEMLGGLHFLHSSGIIHRDLKPENILLTLDRKVRICDMGLAKPIDTAKSYVGTSVYIAPEVVNSLPHSTSADVYSVGVILLEVWNAKRVKRMFDIDGLKIEEIIQCLMEEKFEIGEHAAQWENFAKTCWEEKPWKRPKVLNLRANL